MSCQHELNVASIRGFSLSEMREAVRESSLYPLGDCRLMWVNEGDLDTLQMVAGVKIVEHTKEAQGDG